jgi:hypothetical protein
LDLELSPRFAASAAPAAICCFLDFAGILLDRSIGEQRMYLGDGPEKAAEDDTNREQSCSALNEKKMFGLDSDHPALFDFGLN